jgi:hypothetical protein
VGQNLHDDRAVYRIILTRVFEDNQAAYKAPKLVIMDKTSVKKDVALGFQQEFRVLTGYFLRLNRRSVKLHPAIPRDWHDVITTDEFNSLIKAGRKLDEAERTADAANRIVHNCATYLWRPFHMRYPESQGVYRLSRIAFSNDRRTAMVLLSMESGCSSRDDLFILERSGRTWSTVRMYTQSEY